MFTTAKMYGPMCTTCMSLACMPGPAAWRGSSLLAVFVLDRVTHVLAHTAACRSLVEGKRLFNRADFAPLQTGEAAAKLEEPDRILVRSWGCANTSADQISWGIVTGGKLGIPGCVHPVSIRMLAVLMC
jgi:hypothetical protein